MTEFPGYRFSTWPASLENLNQEVMPTTTGYVSQPAYAFALNQAGRSQKSSGTGRLLIPAAFELIPEELPAAKSAPDWFLLTYRGCARGLCFHGWPRSRRITYCGPKSGSFRSQHRWIAVKRPEKIDPTSVSMAAIRRCAPVDDERLTADAREIGPYFLSGSSSLRICIS